MIDLRYAMIIPGSILIHTMPVVGRAAENPSPWGPAVTGAVVGAVLGGLIGGTTAVLLYNRGKRASERQTRDLIVARDQQHRELVETIRHREAATALAMGEASEARQSGDLWIEMDNDPPIFVNDEAEEPMPLRRPMPVARPTHLRRRD